MNNVTYINNVIYKVGETIEFSYPCGEEKPECYPYVCLLSPGKYLLEVNGAEGGRSVDGSFGGFGGYSNGTLTLNEETVAFIYVGAHGSSTKTGVSEKSQYSFNGGGFGINSERPENRKTVSSGGGATDIRLVKDDLYHRVIVAGGGGGTSYYDEVQSGGNGGGLWGLSGEIIDHNGGQEYSGKGGNQTGDSILFGYGENVTKDNGSGGGGGWFGGTSGYGYTNAGGGGSGYVFSIENYKTGMDAGLQLSTQYLLTDANTQEMGVNGRKEDGFAQITIISYFIKRISYIHCNQINLIIPLISVFYLIKKWKIIILRDVLEYHA